MKGIRKLIFGGAGLAALFAGLALGVFREAVLVAYAAYATGVVTIVSAVVLGNVGEHFASKGKAP